MKLRGISSLCGFINQTSMFRMFCTSSSPVRQIPQFIEAQSFYRQQKLSQAITSYRKTLQILQTAHVDINTYEHNLVFIKLLGSLVLNSDYNKLESQLKVLNSIQNRDICNFGWFIEGIAKQMSQTNQLRSPKTKQQQQLWQISKNLLNYKDKIQQTNEPSFFFLQNLSTQFNNHMDYQNMVLSLLDTSKVTIKQEQKLTQKNLDSAFNLSTISPGIQLVYHLAITLNNKISKATPEYKKAANTRISQILKKFEEEDKQSKYLSVYQPLINIACNLIKQKQYMSGQGIVGHIKSGESGLYQKGQSQEAYSESKDVKLQEIIFVQILYRMLVSRATNQDFSLMWPRVGQFKPGLFVAQRIVLQSIKNMDQKSCLSGIFI